MRGPESATCFADTSCPWPPAFPPAAPRRHVGALFVGVHGTTQDPDFRRRHIIGDGQTADFPVPAQGASTHAAVWGHAASAERSRPPAVLPSAARTASAPWTSYALSRLNGRPRRTPVNASPDASRWATHDSGPVRLARPSP